MNRSLLIRFSAIAAVSLAAVASTAKAGHPPRPLGAGHQPLSPGVQVLDLVSREHPPGSGPKHLPRIAITLPKGWFNYDGWAMNDGGTLVVSFWDVAKVYGTPCRWQTKPKVDPGPSVADLASTLARQPLRHASKPRSAALGGFPGKYLSWSVPNKIDLGRCGQGYFESWTAKGWASDRYQQAPGQVDRLWILDVKGQRLLIDAASEPWATRKQRIELGHIVHSIKFLSDSSRRPASAATSPVVSTVEVPLAANGGGTSGEALQIEQLGPKHLLGAGSPLTPSTTPATLTIPVTLRTLEVEELGPKYLLGR
jgi:hypothetical protein